MSIYCGPLSAGPQRPGLCWGDLGVATVPFRSGHSRKLTGGNRTPAPRPGHRTPHTRMPHARDTASAIRTSVAQRDRDRADLCHRRDASIDPVRLTAPGGSPPPRAYSLSGSTHRSVGTRIES